MLAVAIFLSRMLLIYNTLKGWLTTPRHWCDKGACNLQLGMLQYMGKCQVTQTKRVKNIFCNSFTEEQYFNIIRYDDYKTKYEANDNLTE